MPKKIFVLFVEPMLYGLDLIREVYDKSGFQMQYYYCETGLTGKDDLELPNGAVLGQGDKKQRKKTLEQLLNSFQPDFCIINGYTGIDQTIAIKYCIKYKIPYGIDSDTPLHIPANPIKAAIKKFYLHNLFDHPFCFGIPGGTPQKENLEYYGITRERNFSCPMTVSSERIGREYNALPSKTVLKKKYGVEGKKVFLFVGRLEPVKNVELLIDAFVQISKENKDVALMIVGDGTLMRSLKEKVKQSGTNEIYFEGYRVFPELIEYYKVADIFVLPSSFEPWGLVVNEAMICGLPVLISSKVGCETDLVDHNKNGIIFESENTEALLSAMKKMLSVDLKLMGEAAKLKMKRWSFESYLPEFQERVTRICQENYQ